MECLWRSSIAMIEVRTSLSVPQRGPHRSVASQATAVRVAVSQYCQSLQDRCQDCCYCYYDAVE